MSRATELPVAHQQRASFSRGPSHGRVDSRVAVERPTYQLDDAPAPTAAPGLVLGGRELPDAARRGQCAQELRRRGSEELLQQLQGPGHDVVVLVLGVVQGQLVHLETGAPRHRQPRP